MVSASGCRFVLDPTLLYSQIFDEIELKESSEIGGPYSYMLLHKNGDQSASDLCSEAGPPPLVRLCRCPPDLFWEWSAWVRPCAIRYQICVRNCGSAGWLGLPGSASAVLPLDLCSGWQVRLLLRSTSAVCCQICMQNGKSACWSDWIAAMVARTACCWFARGGNKNTTTMTDNRAATATIRQHQQHQPTMLQHQLPSAPPNNDADSNRNDNP